MFDKRDSILYGYEDSESLSTKCSLCNQTFKRPLILSCLHIFDKECLAKHEQKDDLTSYVKCPSCSKLSGSIKTLKNYDVSLVQENKNEVVCEGPLKCTICTEGNDALFRCINCAGTLCNQCNTIHKIVKFFSNHEVIELTEDEKSNPSELLNRMKNSKPVACREHPERIYSLFCLQCHVPMCQECTEKDHSNHVNCDLIQVPERFKPILSKVINASQEKKEELNKLSSEYHNILHDVTSSCDNNKATIESLYDSWIKELSRTKETLLEKNTKFHENIEMEIWSKIENISKTVDHIDSANEFSKNYFQKCSNVDMCELAGMVVSCFETLNNEDFGSLPATHSVFKPGVIPISDILRSNFGSFEHETIPDTTLTGDRLDCKNQKSLTESGFDMTESFKRLSMKSESDVLSMFMLPNNIQISPNGSHSSRGGCNGNMIMPSSGMLGSAGSNNLHSILNSNNASTWNGLNINGLDPSISPDFDNHSVNNHHLDPSGIQSLIENNVLGNGSSSSSNLINSLGSNGNSLLGLNSGSHGTNGMLGMGEEPFGMKHAGSMVNSKPTQQPIYTPSLYEYSRLRNARCSQMNLLVKWGNMGCELGRLNSPHGFCLGFDEEIVVADTHNHRIQIFSKRGQFQSFFGVSGRVDGLLWYPRKVAIIRQSQRYVVCDRGNERSRMQLFSRSGHFVRRIAIRYIDIVAGLAINQHGHIVAIDSVSPSVFVVSEEGDLIKWFDCSNYMREPSDVAIHGREYYICDFKAHCVVVFQEDGKFIRRIGGETITDYPNGIDVSDHGDVLVGDSHGNRFHIAVFNRNGELQCEFVCNQTKVSRSCCLKITTEGYVVTLARSSNNVLVIDTLYVC